VLETVIKGMAAAFPQVTLDSPAWMSDERLRADLQWRAGAHSAVRFLTEHLEGRKPRE
jgi:hypothetical protein